MKNIIKYKNRIGLILMGLLSITLVRCVVPEQPEKEVTEMQVMEFIESDSTKSFTEFDTIAKKVGMDGILSTRGPFTVFLPDNDAFQDYYKSKGKSSFDDFTIEELTEIIRNHVVPAEISSTNVSLGSLSEKNALGDYLVSEFEGSDIIINKYSKIVKRDIYVANGVIHRVDKVIDPVNKGVFSTINDIPEFSIFAKGLELSGLNDTLNISTIPYGLGTARVRYTILAVPDSIYNLNGIYSVEDLVAKYDNGVGSINEIDNGFYEYMVYHCLDKTNYLSSLATGIIDVISHNNYVYFEVGNEYLINPEDGDSVFTTFVEKYCNFPAKNGVIHAINQLLPVKAPTARTFVFDVTSFTEFEEMELYKVDGTVRNFYDGENGFAKIKWTGDYMQYWCKAQGTGFVNDDCLVMSQGYWTLEVTTPRITRGKYSVTGYFKKGSNRANVIFYVDGERIDNVIELNGTTDPFFVEPEICQVNWTTTQEHVFKVVTVYPGVIMWDRLTFEPIE